MVNEIEIGEPVYTQSIITNNNGEIMYKKDQKFYNIQDWLMGTVTIGVHREPIYVPGKCHIKCTRQYLKNK